MKKTKIISLGKSSLKGEEYENVYKNAWFTMACLASDDLKYRYYDLHFQVPVTAVTDDERHLYCFAVSTCLRMKNGMNHHLISIIFHEDTKTFRVEMYEVGSDELTAWFDNVPYDKLNAVVGDWVSSVYPKEMVEESRNFELGREVGDYGYNPFYSPFYGFDRE